MSADKLQQKVLEAAARSEGARPFSGNDTASPCELAAGRRVLVEFYCANCGSFIYVKLNVGLNGNHIMVCPQCSHKHYRVVFNGVITSDRFNEAAGLADEIIPPKSAATKVPRQRSQMSIIREMELVGLLK